MGQRVAQTAPPRAKIRAPPSGKLGLRTIGTRPVHWAGHGHGINLPLSVFEAGSGSLQENVSKKTEARFSFNQDRTAVMGMIVGSNRIRTVLGLGALAAFGAAELAVVYGVVGAIMELTLGVDVPLIGLVDSGDDSSSGCT